MSFRRYLFLFFLVKSLLLLVDGHGMFLQSKVIFHALNKVKCQLTNTPKFLGKNIKSKGENLFSLGHSFLKL